MHDRVFKHTEAYKLDDPQRLEWMPPAEVIAPLHLVPGMKVADVGAGTGYFTLPIARAVGDAGRVFAVDLQPEMLELLRHKIESANISLHQGNASQLPLQDATVDIVCYANIWHELQDPVAALREATRVSVRGGKIAIVDWRSDCSPPPGPPLDHRLSSDSIRSFLSGHGCSGVSSQNVGRYGYLVIGELPRL
jgi:ubiquinone/menaquinone biosynthesis C-methylase UbiE